MGTEPTIYGVRIYLDTAEVADAVGPELETGLFTPVMATGQTSTGSRVITFAPYWGTYQFKVGRKVLISKGFPSTTHYYLIKSKTYNTITIDDSEDAASSNQTGVVVQQQSEFRWAEIGIMGDEHNDWQNWIGGMLAENPIDGIEEGGDTTQGGCPVQYEGLSVTVCNTEKLLLLLNNIGVNLNNLPVEIYRHIPNYGFGPPIEKTVIFTGICEEITWNETDLVIKCKNTRYKRNASHATVLDNGVVVPMTFGILKPENPEIIECIAKMLRENDIIDEDHYTNAFFNGTNPDITAFPVVNLQNENVLCPGTTATYFGAPCKITFQINGNAGSFSIADNTILEVVDGDGSGQFALVDSIATTGTPNQLLCTLKTLMKTSLSKGESPNEDKRSWIRFILVDRNYILDIWPCKGFIDKSGNALSNNAELYSLSDKEKLIRISDRSYEFLGVPDKNKLNIRIENCSEDINKILSYTILPITNLQLITSPNLNDWGGLGAFYYKIDDGVYIDRASVPSGFQHQSALLANVHYATDKTMYPASFIPRFKDESATGINISIICAFKFEMPDLPPDIDISLVHLGIFMYVKTNGGGADYYPKFHVERFRWPGLAFQKSTDRVPLSMDALGLNRSDGFILINLPDNYFNPYNDSKNYPFIKEMPDINVYYRTGVDTFKIPSITKENYKQLKTIGIFTQIIILKDVWYNWEHYIRELAVVLNQGTIDIGKELHTPFAGRVFNSTWGGRKTATNMITNPIEITEHIKRLGNWGETGEKKNWGKEYATTAKIKTSGEGSFDDASLADIKTFSPAFQLFDEDKMNSDSIITALCRNFDFCSYIDADGNECVSPLYKTNPTETIELKDVVGDIGEIKEPDSNDIFCEPVVKYAYDATIDSFKKTLAVNNIESDAWQSSFTPGFNATDGEIVWNKCKSLYVRFRQITQPSGEFTDQYMIPTYDGAVKYLIAKLDKMARRRVPLSVYYAKGKDYHFAKHVMLKLAYHTNDYSLECFIERIKKNKNDDLVELTLVLIDDITIMDYIIQDIAAGGTPERGVYQEVVSDPIEKYQDSANQRG